MAQNTCAALNQAVIYELSLFNFAKDPIFDSVIEELDRLKALGVDIVWLMPIHPRAQVGKLGTLGSAYSLADFRAIHDAHGDFVDFARLVEAVHARGMKLMLDIVYNHTSKDSVLLDAHPEFFYQDENGAPTYRFWDDVCDLDYANADLCAYQVETAVIWAKLGVDGYRCDVAPMVPLRFWEMARAQVAKVNPDFIWLAETHHYPFLTNMRAKGWNLHSDCEMYSVFDITYDYDVHYDYENYLKGTDTLKTYVDAINRQRAMYPMNFIKLRFLENHDQVRCASLIRTELAQRQWTAFSFFEKGAALLYAGQEFGVEERTHVTEPEVFVRNARPDLTSLIAQLSAIKKGYDIVRNGFFELLAPERDSLLVAQYTRGDEKLIGLFNFRALGGTMCVPLADGVYENLLGGTIQVKDGKTQAPLAPAIVHVTGKGQAQTRFAEHGQ